MDAELGEPVTRKMSVFLMGRGQYDDSFEIEDQNDMFLGECGAAIAETIGEGSPTKVAAIEVWLFDKDDFVRTLTGVSRVPAPRRTRGLLFHSFFRWRMTLSSKPPRSEVRSYLRRLLTAIAIGIVLMASTAIWAWNTYGAKLKDAPPLPEGTPPMSAEPATPY
jgi:hypothetical protein